MFEMLEQKVARPRRWTKLVGLAVVAAILGSVIMVQKLFPQTAKELIALARETIIAPAPPPSRPPAAPEPPKVKPPTKQFRPPGDGKFHAPPVIPTVVNLDPEPPGLTPPTETLCPDCVVNKVPGSNVPGGFGPPLLVAAPAPPPPPKVVETPKVPEPPTRIRRGGEVQAANLIRKVVPQYPPLAKQARVQGVVRFTAVIAKDGTIQQLTLVAGHPLLVSAATAAVKLWVYKPTTLNGEPVEVITQIDVNFTLAQ